MYEVQYLGPKRPASLILRPENANLCLNLLKFGPNSFFEHQKEAKKICIRSIIAPADSLKDDLDTGIDLEKFKSRQPKFFQTI